MRLARSQHSRSMVIGAIALVVLAGCSPASDAADADPASTEIGRGSEGGSADTTEFVKRTDRPPTPRSGPSPTPVTSSYDADGDGYMTAEELKTAVNGTVSEYQFPPEYQVSGDQLVDPFLAWAQTSGPDSEAFQVGMEHTIISGHHQCAWERVYLQAHSAGDEARQEEALNALFAGLRKQDLDPGSLEWVEGMYRKAQLGDPSLVANDVNLNCGGIGELTQVPGTSR